MNPIFFEKIEMKSDLSEETLSLKRKEKRFYYIFGLLTLSFAYYILVSFEVSYINRLYFFVAFFWNYAILTPGIKKTISNRKYRFSFLRVIYWLGHLFEGRLKGQFFPYFRVILRAIIPVLFVFTLMIFSNYGSILFAIFGVMLFELFLLVFRKGLGTC